MNLRALLAVAVLAWFSFRERRGSSSIQCRRRICHAFRGSQQPLRRRGPGHAAGPVRLSSSPRIHGLWPLMSHIATTKYQFCAGLKDSQPPALPSPSEKDTVVKFLSDSFDYCSGVISNLTDAQLSAVA